MQMLILLVLAASLQAIICRDVNKSPKLLPTISNSLVNLGKMDISFYFNSKPDSTWKSMDQSHNPPLPTLTAPSSNIFDKPCPCTNLGNIKDSFLNNPSEVISKILRTNDLFTNKNPTVSTFCCDTAEREDTVYFEIMPNQNKITPTRANSFPSLLFDSLIPTRQVSPIKSKAVEIFLYPKRKDLTTFQFPKIFPKKNILRKDRIQVVGDKTLEKDVKVIKSSTSVKKDLQKSDVKDTIRNEVAQKTREDDFTKANLL